MSNSVLNTVIKVRQGLKNVQSDNGQISGNITVTQANIDDLKKLADAFIIEDTIVLDSKTLSIEKLSLDPGDAYDSAITLLTLNLDKESYFESLGDFINAHPYEYPPHPFYIQDLKFTSSATDLHPELIKYKSVLSLIELLSTIADYVQEHTGEPKTLIFFDKKKISVPLVFNRNYCRQIAFLEELKNQLTSDHDKDQRIILRSLKTK
jgi:hypothetical protein